MEYIPRLTEPFISEYVNAAASPVLLVTGAPQVGKTRLIEHVLELAKPKRMSFSLKIHSHFRAQVDACSGFNQFRKLLEDEYRFDARKGTILFIDDIQESPALATFIPRLRDAWHGCPIILCGSLLPDAYDALLAEPSPRLTHVTVRPYQFSEFLKANQKGSLSRHVEHGKTAIFEDRHSRLLEWLERFLEVGGLPEVVDWASHGEDFSSHLDEIITDIEVQIDANADRLEQDTVVDALRNVSEGRGSSLDDDVTRALERWGLSLNMAPSSVGPGLYDLGFAHQLSLAEPPSFWDAESGDSEALARVGEFIKQQTALSLRFQDARLAPLENIPADFILDTGADPVPIRCSPLFTLDTESTDSAFDMIHAGEASCGIIIGLTPFEAVERDGKRLLSVPLYLTEALLDIISRPV